MLPGSSEPGSDRPARIGLALFQPEIPGNVGAAIRLAACLDLPLAVIEPTGFVWDPRRLRRIALDYTAHARITRHRSFAAFEADCRTRERRLILLSRHAAAGHLELRYRPGDVLLARRETDGVPEDVRSTVDAAVRVPLQPGCRSLNLVTALAIVAGEALRQTGGFGAVGA